MPVVLVVNDDAVQLTMIAGLLTRDGFEVLSVDSAGAAVILCGQRSVDLILTDLNMPEMSGDELLHHLRSQVSGYARVPVILFSASPPDTELCDRIERGLGGKGRLLAPYRLPELRREVKHWLTLEAGPEGPPAPEARSTPHVEDSARPSESLSPEVLLDPVPYDKLVTTGGKLLVERVVGMFLSKAPTNLQGAREALAAGELATAERLIHSTKGSAGMIGAVGVARLAAEAEECAAGGHTRQLELLLDRLEAVLTETMQALQARLAG